MNAATVLQFQLGKRQAIWTVARSKAAFWTGMVLVLITAIPRNYDQLSISENTMRWICGPLGFSLISGTWTYLIAYEMGTAAGIRRSGGGRQSRLSDWMGFMGLFWMTAPIAWLYAIPVERFLDPVSAAQTNVTLLAVVAGWRVILMTRVLQVTCDWGFGQALSWVLVATSAEVFVVGFFGKAFSRSLMAGMAGMRMSPAEDVITNAFVSAMFLAVPVFLVAALVALEYGTRGNLQALPKRHAGRLPWDFLMIAALVWMAIAIWPQLQVEKNVKLDRLVASGQFDEAVRFMNSRKEGDFSPSRELAPKAYERSLYEQLPAMIAVADDNTAAWVWNHLLRQLDVLVLHVERDRHFRVSKIRWNDLLIDIAEGAAGREWIQQHRVRIAALIRERVLSISNDREMKRAHREALSILETVETELGVVPEQGSK